jgi:hypothetical protein
MEPKKGFEMSRGSLIEHNKWQVCPLLFGQAASSKDKQSGLIAGMKAFSRDQPTRHD